MKLGCNAIELSTGEIYHITGSYNSRDEMAEALLKDGFVVIDWWEAR